MISKIFCKIIEYSAKRSAFSEAYKMYKRYGESGFKHLIYDKIEQYDTFLDATPLEYDFEGKQVIVKKDLVFNKSGLESN